ncbi:Eco47II family restriction endonuclease [Rickettsiales bacterium LUAb2]
MKKIYLLNLFPNKHYISQGFKQAGLHVIDIFKNNNYNITNHNFQEFINHIDLYTYKDISLISFYIYSNLFPKQKNNSFKQIILKLNPKMFLLEVITIQSIAFLESIFEELKYKIYYQIIKPNGFSSTKKRLIVIGVKIEISIDYKFPDNICNNSLMDNNININLTSSIYWYLNGGNNILPLNRLNECLKLLKHIKFEENSIINLYYNIALSIKFFLDKLEYNNNFTSNKKISYKTTKYKLGFISDYDLFHHVRSTIDMFRFNLDLQEFNQNIIDPIKLTFDSKVYNKTMKEIIEAEVFRQIDKSNTNQIGYFHQNIFKYIGGKDWIVPKQGFDVVNKNKNIYVEIKNKHNTMNSSSSQKTYMRMQNQIIYDPASICFLVEIISKKSQNTIWTISLDSNTTSNIHIRRLSIDKFYELVTFDKYAFLKLCKVLPYVLNDVIKDMNNKNQMIHSTVLEELESLSKTKDLMKSLYILGFSKYAGFSNNYL